MNDLTEKQLKAIDNTIHGSFYKTNKKLVPDSRIIQSVANNNMVETKEVFSEQNDEYTKVIASATLPNGNYVEDVVIHHFATVLQKMIVDCLGKELKKRKNNPNFKSRIFNDLDNPFELKSNGSITPNLTFKGQLKFIKDMTKFKYFSVRDAYSKAANRAQKRVLKQEFREKDEIMLEDNEVKQIAGDAKVTKQSTKVWNSFDDEISEDFLEDLENEHIKKAVNSLVGNTKTLNKKNLFRELGDMFSKSQITADEKYHAQGLLQAYGK